MTRTVAAAAIQLDGGYSSPDERLTYCAGHIADAVAGGAKLVLLPELFNTGLTYDDALYPHTETLDGQTVNWLRDQAIRHDVMIAGSLLLRDADHVYNAALLITSDGHIWRYDKQNPYLWERAFFREGRRITVASTSHGHIGLLTGWDALHADVWERYAGRVDMLLVMNNLPDFSRATLRFPDGERVSIRDLVPLNSIFSRIAHFDDIIQQQAAWAGVPVVVASSGGQLCSVLQAPRTTLSALLALRSDLRARLLDEAADVIIEAPFVGKTQIIDDAGQSAAQMTDETGFVQGHVTLADELPRPSGEQPSTGIPAALYGALDGVFAGAMSGVYQRGVRRQWGARMAPVDRSTRFWQMALVGAFAAGALLPWLFKRRD